MLSQSLCVNGVSGGVCVCVYGGVRGTCVCGVQLLENEVKWKKEKGLFLI